MIHALDRLVKYERRKMEQWDFREKYGCTIYCLVQLVYFGNYALCSLIVSLQKILYNDNADYLIVRSLISYGIHPIESRKGVVQLYERNTYHNNIEARLPTAGWHVFDINS